MTPLILALQVALGSVAIAGNLLAEPEFYSSPDRPGAPFSMAVIAGDTIYLAGHLGRDPETNEFPSNDIADQTRQTMLNIETTLKGVGATFSDVVKCTVFLADMADFSAMNAVYVEFFDGPKPARTTVGANGLALDARVEIECIAARPQDNQ